MEAMYVGRVLLQMLLSARLHCSKGSLMLLQDWRGKHVKAAELVCPAVLDMHTACAIEMVALFSFMLHVAALQLG
jgi:hypothetical protein